MTKEAVGNRLGLLSLNNVEHIMSKAIQKSVKVSPPTPIDKELKSEKLLVADRALRPTVEVRGWDPINWTVPAEDAYVDKSGKKSTRLATVLRQFNVNMAGGHELSAASPAYLAFYMRESEKLVTSPHHELYSQSEPDAYKQITVKPFVSQRPKDLDSWPEDIRKMILPLANLAGAGWDLRRPIVLFELRWKGNNTQQPVVNIVFRILHH